MTAKQEFKLTIIFSIINITIFIILACLLPSLLNDYSNIPVKLKGPLWLLFFGDCYLLTFCGICTAIWKSIIKDEELKEEKEEEFNKRYNKK